MWCAREDNAWSGREAVGQLPYVNSEASALSVNTAHRLGAAHLIQITGRGREMSLSNVFSNKCSAVSHSCSSRWWCWLARRAAAAGQATGLLSDCQGFGSGYAHNN